MAWVASLSDTPKEADLAKMGTRQAPLHRVLRRLPRPGAQGPAGGRHPVACRRRALRLHEPRGGLRPDHGTGRKMMPGFTTSPRPTRTPLSASSSATSAEAGAPASADAPPPRIPYRFNGYNRWVDSKGYPAISPPWGTLSAIDLNTGEYLWKVTLGRVQGIDGEGHPPDRDRELRRPGRDGRKPALHRARRRTACSGPSTSARARFSGSSRCPASAFATPEHLHGERPPVSW
jgi:quinoprotein glucose dehydrogenase